MSISLLGKEQASGDRLAVEIVERKGRGHPDSICDAIAEEVSLALSRRYIEVCGEIRHHNVDKALLWAGSSEPEFGGGRLTAPMELFIAGRGTAEAGGINVDVAEIATTAAAAWFAANFPALEPSDVVRHALIRPTSPDLRDLFGRGAGDVPRANDSSIGTGYAPLSRLERLVLAADAELERMAASMCPAIGADTKILAVREGEQVRLTIACALIDSHVDRLSDYLEAKAVIAGRLGALAKSCGFRAAVEVNAADVPETGSIYLTVTGTSAEGGDDGQAGRGNRVNGLITPFRAMTIESAAGKNAVSHVGKLYNLAAGLIAERISRLEGVIEAQCLLVSAIGRPITEPQIVDLAVRVATGCGLDDHRHDISQVLAEELDALKDAGRALASGELRIGRWPLRNSAPPHPGSSPGGSLMPR